MHAYTHAHWNGPGGFKRKGGKCCRGNSCTYFLCFMTIVINVQAITHSHRRTSTAALEDLAISINVLCPSVAVSSFPFKKKKIKILPRRDTVSALLTAELSVSVALWRMETMGLFFLCCLVLCVNRPYVFPLCTLGVFLCSFFFFIIIFLKCGLHSRLSFSEARKKQIQK